jgi:DNA-binding MarR family transcriptional regulator
MSHATSRLDPLIHQPARLGILSAACDTKRIDFVSLRDLLDLTDGNLSRHLGTLEGAGYIKTEKTFDKKKPRTWISATKAGRKALAAEIEALREIVAAAEQVPAPGRKPARPAPRAAT